MGEIVDKYLPDDSRSGESIDQVDRLLSLMAQDDSELLNIYRALRDKGVIAPEFLPKRAKMAKSSEIVKEKEKLSLSSYFQNFGLDDKEEDDASARKADPDSGKVKVSQEEKGKLLSRVGRVISRRRTTMCRKFALDNKLEVPVWPKEESDGEEESAAEGETSSSDEEEKESEAKEKEAKGKPQTEAKKKKRSRSKKSNKK